MLTRTKLDQWCNAALEAGWLAALVVAPLFFNVFSSRVFEPDKISLVRTIALAMTVVWLVKVANGGYAWLPALARQRQPGAAARRQLARLDAQPVLHPCRGAGGWPTS
jgi:uncharacterized membrane protein